MAEPNVNHVIHIDEKLARLPPVPLERCIYRVHDELRNENMKAYEPVIVAVGPYHHGKDKLQPMEEHKLHYLQQLLSRRNERSVERYFMAMQESEEQARKFYAESISLDSNNFVEMMLLDGCFIIELFRKHANVQLIENDDPIFKLNHIQSSLMRDLMLIENQLPFFILMQLFDMTQISASENFVDMVYYFFKESPQWTISVPPENRRQHEIKHILGLLHCCCCYQYHSTVSQRNVVPIKNKFLKSATELQEAGIKFKKCEGRSLFDIRFANGTMEIPTLIIDDDTESYLRNLIAYEEYLPNDSSNYFTAYQNFMDYLVNSSKDVDILCHRGIIHNFLGDNEVVSTMLNKLGNNSMSSFLSYHEVYNNVNEHCSGKWNLWLAILRRDYFHTPWALISFLGVVMLLLLTMAQTIFSIISVGKLSA